MRLVGPQVEHLSQTERASTQLAGAERTLWARKRTTAIITDDYTTLRLHCHTPERSGRGRSTASTTGVWHLDADATRHQMR